MNQRQIDNRNKKRDAIIQILNGETWDEVETLLEQSKDHVKFYAKVKLKKNG